ncbi:MAG: ABC transporter ATP-binding protein [bacterium]
MPDQLLTVTGLSKKYCRTTERNLRYGVADIASELSLGSRQRNLRPDEFWVLDDVSFTLGRGESLAVVGRNGAGKTTLLKLLFGLIKPDRGEIRLRGRVEAVLELGAGFSPVLSGRENVNIGAALHGLHGAAARLLLDEVIAFAELEDAIDAPVQAFSSGMRARLAFSLATHLTPDILMIDEALAVGDIGFQRKCVARMRDYLARGGALLFVSHSAFQVQAVCERGILLERGKVVFAGSAIETLNQMFEANAMRADEADRLVSRPDVPIVIEAIDVRGVDGGPATTGAPVDIVLRYRSTVEVPVVWGFVIMTGDQWVCAAGAFCANPFILSRAAGQLRCRVERFALMPGHYVVRAAIGEPTTSQPLASLGWHQEGTALQVKGDADAMINFQMQLNQLVVLDANWA